MVDAGAPPRSDNKNPIERQLELWLFRSRWLMAPFYAGLVAALAALLYVFCAELIHQVSHIGAMTEAQAILMALSLIDLSLTANLVLIVIFAGYENFVSKIEAAHHEDRPTWMGAVDFSNLKLKLIASIVAISAIAMLRGLMRKALGEPVEDNVLAWLLAMHVAFVISCVLLALTDFIAAKTRH